MHALNTVTKSLTAAAIAGAAALQTANADQLVTTSEWVNVAGAFLVALVLVWAVPNTPEVTP
jgi:hypothetical protein